MSGCHSGQADEWIGAHRRDCFQRHVAGALHGPFVVLFEEDGADEPGYGGLVGEDSDDLSATLDLAVEAFERVRAVELCPMLGWETHVGQHIRLGVVHQRCELGQLRPELIGNGAPLPGGIHRIILREGRGDEG